MQRLIIDIGNSLVKLAVFNNDQTIMTGEIREPDTGYIQKLIAYYPEIKSSILSAVKNYPIEIDKLLRGNFFHIRLDSQTPLPFTNQYTTPETLGKDRIAAAAAAVKLFPNKNVLVIDAGTSITYEMVTEKGVYLGGGISPGIQMRFKALNTFTGKLPLITTIDDAELIGDNTQNSIRSGVLNGVVAEVEGIISHYSKRFKDLRIIISGGDYNYFDKKLKNSIFATPNIVMQGLMEILKFNEDQ
jgi:type III pantothenate kinase